MALPSGTKEGSPRSAADASVKARMTSGTPGIAERQIAEVAIGTDEGRFHLDSACSAVCPANASQSAFLLSVAPSAGRC